MLDRIVLKTDFNLSDEEFFNFAISHAPLQIERTAEKQIIIMSPTGSDTGRIEADLTYYIKKWSMEGGDGICFSSSAGFTLPNGAVRSPDASWIRKDRWEKLTEEQKEVFAPVCPDFVVEICSRRNSLKDLKAKMQEYIDNGARLGWLIDPIEEKAYIYRPDTAMETVEGFNQKLSGENVLDGFVFELKHMKE